MSLLQRTIFCYCPCSSFLHMISQLCHISSLFQCTSKESISSSCLGSFFLVAQLTAAALLLWGHHFLTHIQRKDVGHTEWACFRVSRQALFHYLTTWMVNDPAVKCWVCLVSDTDEIPQDTWHGTNTAQILQPYMLKFGQDNHYGLGSVITFS